MTTMPKRTSDYRSWQLEKLGDSRVAASYLNAAINDSPKMFLKALRNVAQAHQMSKVAKKSGVTRESLYRSFSGEGNPTFDTLRSVLRVFGLNLAVTEEQGKGMLVASESSFGPHEIPLSRQSRGSVLMQYSRKVEPTTTMIWAASGVGEANVFAQTICVNPIRMLRNTERWHSPSALDATQISPVANAAELRVFPELLSPPATPAPDLSNLFPLSSNVVHQRKGV